MYGVEHHVLGVVIDATETFYSLGDETIMGLVAQDKESLLFLGEDMLGEGKSEIEYIKVAARHKGMEKFHVAKIFKDMLWRDNWIKIFEGRIIGKSENMPNEDLQYLVIGVYTHDILVGLGKDRKEFEEWFIDHMNTYEVKITTDDVKYYHLGPYI